MKLILNKEIDLDMVLTDSKPRGIIHAGAYVGGCYATYKNHKVKNRCWIEANPEVFKKLLTNIPVEDIALNIAVCDIDGDIPFIITTNDQSNSILSLKKHKEKYPWVTEKKQQILTGRRIDTLIEQGLIDISKYDFLLMDLQGAEYLALKGFEKNINKINYIVSEINYEELYDGCMLVDDFDKYLKESGFRKVLATQSVNFGWGDAYYKRVNK